MGALVVHEPFEGTPGTTFIGSTGGTGWNGPWVLTGDGTSASVLFEAFSQPYSDGTLNLAESGEAGLLNGNTGPVERPVAASTANNFSDGDTLWFSFRLRMERTDRQSGGAIFDFNGGSLLVELESDPVNDDDTATIRVGTVDSPPVSPMVNTDFFLVGKIVFSDSGAETIKLWRDPALGSAPSDGTALVSVSLELGSSLTNVSINSDGAATDGRFDEIRIGEAFSDVLVGVTPPVPVITSFTADKTLVLGGEPVELTWEVEDAANISITPSVGSGLGLSGSDEVTPSVDTVYELIADNVSGAVTQTVSVAVVNIDFSAAQNVITNSGESVQLSWTVSGAVSASIDQGVGSVALSGNESVSPASNTVYTLTATRPEGSVFKKVFTYFADQMPPNILFIAIDDLKRIGGYFADDPGNFIPRVYPDPAVRAQIINHLTPNMDQLAAEGVSFMRAYCASPACNPSRAALMTGIRAHKTGLTNNKGGIFFRDWTFGGVQPLADAVTLTEHLMANGYYAAGTGKIYHGTSFYATDGNKSWEDWEIVTGNAGSTSNTVYANGGSPIGWGQEGPDSASYTNMLDYRRAEFIAKALETGSSGSISLPAGKPFFLACGIQKPHLPYYATKDLADLFPTQQMTGVTRELHDEFLNDCGDLPPTGLVESGGAIAGDDVVLGSDRFVTILQNGLDINPVDGDLNGWKDMLKYYFACSALADRAVGRLLEGLANSPYADNTIVILWSDHGYHLGEKMHVTKFALWEDSAGVHFIIKDPKYPQGFGIKCQRPVNLSDIYPTVCARVGLPLPDPRITGHDLAPLLADPRTPWNIPSLCTDDYTNSNMIAMDRFKLIRYKGDSSDAELYDHDADPDEYHNLIGNPAYAAEQADMFNILDIAVEEGTFPNERQWSIGSWRHGYWGRSTNAGDAADGADPDGDGWNNFREFALLGNPLVASPELTNAISFAVEGGEAVYRFPFRDAPGSVGYEVDETTDLMDGFTNLWDSASDSVDDVTETDHGNGTRNLRVGMLADQPKRFMQLKIIEP